MLENFLNKKVRVCVLNHLYSVRASGFPKELKGTLEQVDDDFIMLSNNVLVAKKFITLIEEC